MFRGGRRHRGRRILLWVLLAALIVCGSAFATNRILTLVNGGGDTPWNLTLVNGRHALPRNWDGALTELRGGESVDSRIVPDLQAMFDDCRAAGLAPIVLSGYRTPEQQQKELDAKTAAYQAEGNGAGEAEKLAALTVAKPGHSEHQLGLAVDIDSEDLTVCSHQQVWDWLAAHCADYGFILRYPEGKESVTGYAYEPWHFRYVGRDAARAITDRAITLEEY
jgi:D-alanyl-D-alanine carboxypeptidase